MNSYIKDLEQYGDILTKEQMRIVCHISKRKATRLLQIGLVPCVNTGKATHTYLIKKTDVLFYLRDREVNPWRYEKRCSQTAYTSFRYHPALWDVLSEQEMRHYYEKKLSSYPEVLTVAQTDCVQIYPDRADRLASAAHQAVFGLRRVLLVVADSLKEIDGLCVVVAHGGVELAAVDTNAAARAREHHHLLEYRIVGLQLYAPVAEEDKHHLGWNVHISAEGQPNEEQAKVN